jgi:hypothetical protein
VSTVALIFGAKYFFSHVVSHGLECPKGEVDMAEWNYAQWAETAGIENLKHRLATGDVLLSQANTLLSILLVGIGGALGLAIKVADGDVSPLVVAAGAAALWMAWVSAVLVHQCIATRETEVVGSAPLNVYKPDLGLTEERVHFHFMEQVQSRIAYTITRNSDVAYWLDRCRYAAIGTPVIFGIAAWVAYR